MRQDANLPKPTGQKTTSLAKQKYLPASWRLVHIGDIALSIVPQRDKPGSFTGSIPWVTLPNFIEGKLTLNHKGNRLELSLEEVKKYRLRVVPAGSVLMSCIGRFGL